ncbi:VIN3-like protein 2 isoform X3 [Populus trichocarpa]|uniref:VIN3-like protein 2 isoform X3 n=1 Tax=Populus trichocarpa TaxID=3694 RepID=UPI002278F7E3|nr:VIN3-like protein 2 isoform X3 [Populus trichocarpa]
MRKPAEEKPLNMMTPGGFVLDPSKCSQLSLGERRELVREIAQWSKDAPEVLSSFTRRELLEIICAEMGKERKYSGYTKFQMIKHLLKLVSKTSKRSSIGNIMAVSPANPQSGFKRPRKKESQAHLSIDLNFVSAKNNSEEYIKMQICENAACGATLSPGDAFCKRCSCCICHYYDDNKDPSLWLTCGSDSLGKRSCGLTCHLICALKDERTGIMKIGCHSKLEGSFYCASCRQVNELMRNWRKQLLVAKEARRVDVLCQRVLLGYRMLTGTEQYKEMQKSMETALQLLKNELGPLDLVCSKMARGIVNRLSCGAEVQKLCASTVEAFDSMCGGSYHGYVEKKEPACAEVPKLCASAVEAFDSMFADNYHGYLEQKELTCKFILTIQVPITLKRTACQNQFEESSPRLQAGKDINENKNEGMNLGSFSPPTPCNSNGMQEVSGLDCKKRVDESAYEYSVRVVKWLELRGHIAEDFRVKFLTWFSLKATLQDRRVVNVFVDALIDDPRSLAEQLIDTFMDKICCDKKPVPWHGFCTKLWH